MAGPQDQPDCPVGSFTLIHLHQTFAKGMHRYPDDGVGLGVKFGPPSERLDCDCVFLDLICPALEVLLANISQHTRRIAGTAQHTGGQKPLTLLPFRLQPQRDDIYILGS